ncbi:conserved exported protein of unknown function [Shewanella benthica]|uniref:UPF0319 protein SHEWBE_2269 n=1 Tax=Shewanella benthica TaxID=43661 RepID=A0A330M1X4_9GAMM|nr:DUF2057 domain-containing protein [Shewanella benthica]SQH76232.1 conserved exported protein of unknown function [Shewanella benthica]
MKHTLVLAVIFTAACSLPAYAKLTLTLPKSAQLLVVNGVEMEDETSLVLHDGNNQIVFKYNTSFWQQGQQRRFSSEAVILTFNGQGSAYKLSLPRLRSNSDADKFNQLAELTLIDDAGVEVEYTSDLLLKAGMQLGRDYDKEIAVYNRSSAPAALPNLVPQIQKSTPVVLPATTVVVTHNSQPAEPVPNTSINQINIGQMLDFWYSQADEETRKAFKDRINQD